MWSIQPCSSFNKPLNEILPGVCREVKPRQVPFAALHRLSTGPSDQAKQLPPLQQKPLPQEQALLLSSQPQSCLPREMRESLPQEQAGSRVPLLYSQPQRCLPWEMRESLLPMLSTPLGMITSAYFFVCKTETVVEEAVNGKSQLHSRKKQPENWAKMEVLQGCKLKVLSW